MGRTRKGPLEGVRVIDLSTVIAAPFGATLLADFGADVIKVEMPKKGDPLRNLGPYYNGEGLRWPGLSRNKKSLTLDLHHEEGKEILRKLCQKNGHPHRKLPDRHPRKMGDRLSRFEKNQSRPDHDPGYRIWSNGAVCL